MNPNTFIKEEITIVLNKENHEIGSACRQIANSKLQEEHDNTSEYVPETEILIYIRSRVASIFLRINIKKIGQIEQTSSIKR